LVIARVLQPKTAIKSLGMQEQGDLLKLCSISVAETLSLAENQECVL
jgi:hypothetical protein